MIITRNNKFKVKLETNKEDEAKYEIIVVCETILELIDLETILKDELPSCVIKSLWDKYQELYINFNLFNDFIKELKEQNSIF